MKEQDLAKDFKSCSTCCYYGEYLTCVWNNIPIQTIAVIVHGTLKCEGVWDKMKTDVKSCGEGCSGK